MIFVLFCFNVWYQESKDIWDIRVLIRTGKIIIFVELLDGWLSSKFGLALIFEIKNSLVKKFVVLHRNLQILFYLSVSRCLHTMYCEWKRQSSKQAVAMLSSISGYFPDHRFGYVSSISIFGEEKYHFCILCTMRTILNKLFIFFGNGRGIYCKGSSYLLFKIHVVFPLIVKNK